MDLTFHHFKSLSKRTITEYPQKLWPIRFLLSSHTEWKNYSFRNYESYTDMKHSSNHNIKQHYTFTLQWPELQMLRHSIFLYMRVLISTRCLNFIIKHSCQSSVTDRMRCSSLEKKLQAITHNYPERTERDNLSPTHQIPYFTMHNPKSC